MLGRWETSRAARPSRRRLATTAAWRDALVESPIARSGDQCLKGEKVALRPQPGDHPYCQIRRHRSVPHLLAGKEVGQVDFDETNRRGKEGIPERHRCVGVAAEIHDRSVAPLAKSLNDVHQGSFV